MSGVIYHVTDPLLAIRICFAYLKEGGKLIIETKASYSNDSISTYSGTAEKGWNWFSPSLTSLQRWFLDAGFPAESIYVHMRPIGRLLGVATKSKVTKLPTRSGFLAQVLGLRESFNMNDQKAALILALRGRMAAILRNCC